MGSCCFKAKNPERDASSSTHLVGQPGDLRIPTGGGIESKDTTKHSTASSELPVDPKTVQFTVGDSAKKKRQNAASKANLFEVKRYTERTQLREMVDRKDVVLLKASWLSKQGFRKRSSLPKRQDLEASEPEAFADQQMTERCLKEVVRAATELVGDDLCHYPGVVVLSYRWRTPEHPDPDGSLLAYIAPRLEWYAAQRAVLGFEPDFCVFIDFCSTPQQPLDDAASAAHNRAIRSMDIWYGHRGTMTWLLSSPPPSETSDPPREYSGGGWPTFELAVCSLGKLPVYCLDMGQFSGGDEKKFTVEWKARHREQFAKEGSRAQRPTDAALQPMVQGTLPSPLTPEAFATLLQTKAFAEEEDRRMLAELYAQISRALLGSATKLSFSQVTWSPADFASFAAASRLAQNVEALSLSDAGLDDAALEAWSAALEEQALAKLTTLRLSSNPCSDAGCAALSAALARGCLPLLAEVNLDNTAVTAAGAAALTSARPGAEGIRVSHASEDAAAS